MLVVGVSIHILHWIIQIVIPVIRDPIVVRTVRTIAQLSVVGNVWAVTRFVAHNRFPQFLDNPSSQMWYHARLSTPILNLLLRLLVIMTIVITPLIQSQ
jgi:hypothetical protein